MKIVNKFIVVIIFIHCLKKIKNIKAKLIESSSACGLLPS